ncbi:RsfA family transcriptional regulator [Bacillus songklensis]|uniref:RsfA family transcriptional regulator n=1 Tax=Bacillus songklensis TaxID=1069116 RepID=A0ABV8B9B6_9BACI
MKDRQDAWTEENDLLLAETVLRHVREGSTQLNAFEEVGDKLNRTSAACGFRWNAVVRHSYEKALQLAKKQRKQRMRALGQSQNAKKRLLYTPPVPPLEEFDNELTPPAIAAPAAETGTEINSSASLSLDHVIAFLRSIGSQTHDVHLLKDENSNLLKENHELKIQNAELQKRIAQLEENSTTIQEDYETLMKIMNRARKFVLLEDEERPSTKFKMDRNGNLEKLAE